MLSSKIVISPESAEFSFSFEKDKMYVMTQITHCFCKWYDKGAINLLLLPPRLYRAKAKVV